MSVAKWHVCMSSVLGFGCPTLPPPQPACRNIDLAQLPLSDSANHDHAISLTQRVLYKKSFSHNRMHIHPPPCMSLLGSFVLQWRSFTLHPTIAMHSTLSRILNLFARGIHSSEPTWCFYYIPCSICRSTYGLACLSFTSNPLCQQSTFYWMHIQATLLSH